MVFFGAPKGMFSDNIDDKLLEPVDIVSLKKVSKIKKRDKFCFYCRAQSEKLQPHPHVSGDFSGNPVYICTQCFKNWKTFRDKAIENQNLFVDGELNEDYCSLCSSSPTELVICSFCPRSYCKQCIMKVLKKREQKILEKTDDWKCMNCYNTDMKNAVSVKIEGSDSTSPKYLRTESSDDHDDHICTTDQRITYVVALTRWLRCIGSIYGSCGNVLVQDECAIKAVLLLLKYLFTLATLDAVMVRICFQFELLSFLLSLRDFFCTGVRRSYHFGSKKSCW